MALDRDSVDFVAVVSDGRGGASIGADLLGGRDFKPCPSQARGSRRLLRIQVRGRVRVRGPNWWHFQKTTSITIFLRKAGGHALWLMLSISNEAEAVASPKLRFPNVIRLGSSAIHIVFFISTPFFGLSLGKR